MNNPHRPGHTAHSGPELIRPRRELILPPEQKITRRAFLGRSLRGLAAAGLGGALGLGAAPARAGWTPDEPAPHGALRETRGFFMARLDYHGPSTYVGPSQWNNNPQGDDNFYAYLKRVSSIKVSDLPWQERQVDIDDLERLYSMPFIFMTGHWDFTFSDAHIAALSEFIKRGGFIYADDCVPEDTNPPGDHFYRASVRELSRLLPGEEARLIPRDHEMFHCFFDLPGQSPRNKGQIHPDMGLFWNGRLVAFITPGDVHCGWWDERWQGNMEACFQMGVNLVIYALTH